VPAYCCRVTYMGELGYELYVPAEYSTRCTTRWSRYRVARRHAVHAGLMALESLRLEKGYGLRRRHRQYRHPAGSRTRFVVDLNKDSFIGREALVAQKSKGTLPKRLVQFLLQDPNSCCAAWNPSV